MRYGDPAEVTCDQCGIAAWLPVADLLDFSARCPACHADLSDHGRAMHQDMDRLEVQILIFEMLIETEEELGTEFPESFLDCIDAEADTISPATFARRVEPVVRELLKGRSSPNLPSGLLADREAGTADETPWIQKLSPNRFAERVAAYPKTRVATASRDDIPPVPDQQGNERAWEKHRYQ